MPDRESGSLTAGKATPAGLEIRPVTPERWDDLVALFGTSPVMSSCWCMSPRLRSSEFSRFGTEARRRNREMMHSLVVAGTIPGLLAYIADRPIGWISIGPREQFARLRRPLALRRMDNSPVWSIVCFYTHREYRRRGITRALIQAAVQHAGARGAGTVEAYPLAGWGKRVGASDACTGMASTFRALGFSEVGISGRNRGEARLVVRCNLPRRAAP